MGEQPQSVKSDSWFVCFYWKKKKPRRCGIQPLTAERLRQYRLPAKGKKRFRHLDKHSTKLFYNVCQGWEACVIGGRIYIYMYFLPSPGCSCCAFTVQTADRCVLALLSCHRSPFQLPVYLIGSRDSFHSQLLQPRVFAEDQG